jgi:hypothetical protein
MEEILLRKFDVIYKSYMNKIINKDLVKDNPTDIIFEKDNQIKRIMKNFTLSI